MNPSDAHLHLLIVARHAAGVNALLSALRRQGHACFAAEATSADELRDSLAQRPWDLLLCLEADSPLPPEDLPALCRQAGWDAPLLLLRDRPAGEGAAALLDLGYSEVLGKEEQDKLPFAVLREAERGRL